MSDSIDEKVFKPGDYEFNKLILINNRGIKLDILALVQEISLYESIYAPSIEGQMVVTENTGLSTHFPIVGQEELEFEIKTPSPNKVQSINFKKYRARVIGVENRKQLQNNTALYIVNFSTKEAFKNTRNRVSQTFEGPADLIVEDILRNNLKTNKNIFTEEALGLRKITIPNITPFTACQRIASLAKSRVRNGAGYLFYETFDGYHFRSFESHFVNSDGTPTTPLNRFYYQPNNQSSELSSQYVNIRDFFVEDRFDHLARANLGMYSSKTFTHDITTKSIKETNFNPFNSFYDKSHADTDGENLIGPTYPTGEDDDERNTFNDFNNNRIYVVPLSKHLYSRDSDDEQDYTTHKSRIAEAEQTRNIMRTLRISINVPGITDYRVGRMIEVFVPRNEKIEPGEIDVHHKMHSGRYLIAEIKHTFVQGYHTCQIEAIKDSMPFVIPFGNSTRFTREAKGNTFGV